MRGAGFGSSKRWLPQVYGRNGMTHQTPDRESVAKRTVDRMKDLTERLKSGEQIPVTVVSVDKEGVPSFEHRTLVPSKEKPVTWNPQTGVNDLEQICKELAETLAVGDLSRTAAIAVERIPLLCDEVERLRRENASLRQITITMCETVDVLCSKPKGK